MKWLIVLAFLLTGCTNAPVAEDGFVSDEVPYESAAAGPLNFTAALANTSAYNEAITVRGAASGALVEIFEIAHGNTTRLYSEQVNGAFQFEYVPAYGQGIIQVRADNGNESAQTALPFVQYAPATLKVDYGAASPNAPVNDAVWINVDGLASAPLYQDVATDHPGYATIHDLMVTWETDFAHDVLYGHSDGLGYSIDQIDGAGNPIDGSLPPWWLYTVNGESADFGMTLQRFVPGDVISWCLGSCS